MIFIGTLFCNLHRDANGLHLRQTRPRRHGAKTRLNNLCRSTPEMASGWCAVVLKRHSQFSNLFSNLLRQSPLRFRPICSDFAYLGSTKQAVCTGFNVTWVLPTLTVCTTYPYDLLLQRGSIWRAGIASHRQRTIVQLAR